MCNLIGCRVGEKLTSSATDLYKETTFIKCRHRRAKRGRRACASGHAEATGARVLKVNFNNRIDGFSKRVSVFCRAEDVHIDLVGSRLSVKWLPQIFIDWFSGKEVVQGRNFIFQDFSFGTVDDVDSLRSTLTVCSTSLLRPLPGTLDCYSEDSCQDMDESSGASCGRRLLPYDEFYFTDYPHKQREFVGLTQSSRTCYYAPVFSPSAAAAAAAAMSEQLAKSNLIYRQHNPVELCSSTKKNHLKLSSTSSGQVARVRNGPMKFLDLKSTWILHKTSMRATRRKKQGEEVENIVV